MTSENKLIDIFIYPSLFCLIWDASEIPDKWELEMMKLEGFAVIEFKNWNYIQNSTAQCLNFICVVIEGQNKS